MSFEQNGREAGGTLLIVVVLISVTASIFGMRKALSADPNEVLAA